MADVVLMEDDDAAERMIAADPFNCNTSTLRLYMNGVESPPALQGKCDDEALHRQCEPHFP